MMWGSEQARGSKIKGEQNCCSPGRAYSSMNLSSIQRRRLHLKRDDRISDKPTPHLRLIAERAYFYYISNNTLLCHPSTGLTSAMNGLTYKASFRYTTTSSAPHSVQKQYASGNEFTNIHNNLSTTSIAYLGLSQPG